MSLFYVVLHWNIDSGNCIFFLSCLYTLISRQRTHFSLLFILSVGILQTSCLGLLLKPLAFVFTLVRISQHSCSSFRLPITTVKTVLYCSSHSYTMHALACLLFILCPSSPSSSQLEEQAPPHFCANHSLSVSLAHNGYSVSVLW